MLARWFLNLVLLYLPHQNCQADTKHEWSVNVILLCAFTFQIRSWRRLETVVLHFINKISIQFVKQDAEISLFQSLKHHKRKINLLSTTLYPCLVTAFIILINKQIERSQLALLHSSWWSKHLTSAIPTRQSLHSKFRSFSNRNDSVVLKQLQGKLTLSLSPEEIVFPTKKAI